MSAGKTWRGFDYRLQREVTKPRAEWRALIEQAKAQGGRVQRGAGDLLVIEGGRIVVEIYDGE